MPFNGDGTFDPLAPPQYPAVAGEIIRAAYFNAVIDDLIGGFDNVLTRDGQDGTLAAGTGAGLIGFTPKGAYVKGTLGWEATAHEIDASNPAYGGVPDFEPSTGVGTDNTSYIQAAIDDALPAGVAVNTKRVLLRAGRWLTGPLVVKPGVTLTGDTSLVSGNPGDYSIGTVLFAKSTLGTTMSAPLLRMLNNSAVYNLGIFYWDQVSNEATAEQPTPDLVSSIIQFPATIEVGQGTGAYAGFPNSDSCRISNVMLWNSYIGMNAGDGTHPWGRLEIDHLWGNPISRGIVTKGFMAETSRWYDIHFYAFRFTAGNGWPNIEQYIRQNGRAFEYLGDTDWLVHVGCGAIGYRWGFYAASGSQLWADFMGCFADVCGLPFSFTNPDRVSIHGGGGANSYLPGSPCLYVDGNVGEMSVNGMWLGDAISGSKTGAFTNHLTGTITFSGCKFKSAFPAILNVNVGAVQVAASGIGYDSVVGQNIKVDGGPPLAPGVPIALTNLNPTSPAATGWTYAAPGNVTAITNGIRIQGTGTNSITYQPSLVSGANANAIFYGIGIYCLEFDFKVSAQAGSPKMEIQLLNASDAIVVDAFQLSQDVASADSGLPEGSTYHVSLILPWQGPTGDASKIRFALPTQSSSTAYELTNMKISQINMQRGFSGLEWFHGKTKLPLGYLDPSTGRQIFNFVNAPPVGTFSPSPGDRTINILPTAGQPKAWVYAVSLVWISEGNL